MYTVYVLINAKVGMEETVRKELARMSNVTRTDLLMGNYDDLAIVEGADLDTLLGGILQRVRAMPGVEKTETLVAREEVPTATATSSPRSPFRLRKKE
ncbi:MAG TPA: Lrp/AsnC family transcriptional regulator [Thermoplasmata archaeon]|nr:Lrp/AsnC family transcriptional regulator [Thermoplasmata archaeon]